MSIARIATLAACAVAAALTVWTLVEQGRTGDDASDRGTLMFPALTETGTNLQRIVVERANYRLELQARDGDWVAPEHGGYPVPAEILNRLVSDLAALRLHEPKTRRPDWYGHIGVDQPDEPGDTSTRVRLLGSDDTVQVDLIIGNRSRSIGALAAGGTFVRRTDEPQAWLVQGTVTVPTSLAPWFGTLLRVPATRVRSISIAEGGEVVLQAEKPQGEAGYRLVSAAPRLGGTAAQVNDEELKKLAGALVSISAQEVGPVPDPSESSHLRTLVFETEDGLELSVMLLEMDGTIWSGLAAEGAPGSAAESEAAEINRKAADRMFLLESRRTDVLTVPLTALVAGPDNQEAAGQ